MNLKGRSWQVGKIIEVAQAAKTGQTGCASTSEKIAVSYILDVALPLLTQHPPSINN